MKSYMVITFDLFLKKNNTDPVVPGDQHFFVLVHNEKEDKAKMLSAEMETFLKDNKVRL